MSDRSILERPELPPGTTHSYGPGPHHVYEIFGDPETAKGWVLLIHGGFWRERWDRTHARPLALALAQEGYAVALVEYARAGTAGGGWPGTFEDLTAATAAVREQSGDAPMVLVGHSAGGHLALWLSHQPQAEGIAGVISLAGCNDLAWVAEHRLGDGAALDLMGGSPADHPERYAVADPARLGPSPYPVVLVHGDADEAVPVEVARAWWEACAVPERDDLVVLEGTSHFPLIDPDHASHQVLLTRIGGLIARQ